MPARGNRWRHRVSGRVVIVRWANGDKVAVKSEDAGGFGAGGFFSFGRERFLAEHEPVLEQVTP